MFRDATTADPVFTDVLELDLGTVQASIAGPKRPQDRVLLGDVKKGFEQSILSENAAAESARVAVANADFTIGNGDVVIAAITSCTNTSNPSVMLAAGLLARNAIAKGLKTKPWVKTSLSPGSQAVAGYLADAGLQESLDALGFNLVGFGCGTCIGNSGPLPPDISAAINQGSLVSVAVLSGNRNFEGRVNPDVRANYLSSPPLVVAYALAGSVLVDMTKEPLGHDQDGQPVFLRDIWPSNDDIERLVKTYVTGDLYKSRYANVFAGDANWRAVQGRNRPDLQVEHDFHVRAEPSVLRRHRDETRANSRYRRCTHSLPVSRFDYHRPYFSGRFHQDGISSRLLFAGTSSPTRGFQSVRNPPRQPRSHDARHVRQYTHQEPDGAGRSRRSRRRRTNRQISRATERLHLRRAMAYAREGVPLVIFAGKEYGTGSSRDWAAKGTRLLGIRAIVAESYERIHRSNLVGMGVAPLMFEPGTTWQSLGLTGAETVSIRGLSDLQKPRQILTIAIVSPDGARREVPALCRIDTLDELEYFRHGGILNFVLRQLAA